MHMEKQLGWAHKLGGTESLWIWLVLAVSARLVESQMWHQPDGSVAPPFLSGRQLYPSSCLDVRHFSSSPYATGALQSATLVLELRGRESE